MSWTTAGWVSISAWGKKLYSSKCPQRFWVPVTFLSNGTKGNFRDIKYPWRKAGHLLQPEPKLRISGAVPPFPISFHTLMLIESRRQIYLTIHYKGDQFKMADMDRVYSMNGYDKDTNKQYVSRNR